MNRIKASYRESSIIRCSKLLSRADQKKIGAVVLLQIFFSLLDLIGVALIGVIGALAIRGVSSRTPGDRVSALLKFLNLNNLEFQTQVAVLAFAATGLLILRTVLSVLFTKKTFQFLALRGALITQKLFSKVLAQSLTGIQSLSSQETLYALTNGVSIIVLGIIGTIVSFISDVSLLLVLSIGVFLVDPTTSILAFVFFVSLGLVMYKTLHKRVEILGTQDYKYTVSGNERILEVLSSYREILVKNRREYYVREVAEIRGNLAKTQSELTFIPYISKYVIETGVVLGAVLISGFQFFINDASRAVATLAIFLAAGTRIAPAVLRVQQSAILIKGNLAVSKPTLDLYEKLERSDVLELSNSSLNLNHDGFIPAINLREVSFSYPDASHAALQKVSLNVGVGEFVVLVGSSGAGKTTLVDVLLGILNPESGKVLLSGASPHYAVINWPGAIGYVPQDVLIINSTIRGNITMGYSSDEIGDELIWESLRIAQLETFVRSLPLGLDAPVGDRGEKLSGGQKQRLGIARAMLSKPKLLILDEATSALDGETEANISDALLALKGSVTVILIAHRLSSVRNADVVVYLEKGEILASGTFEEVRHKVPDFNRQAKLMGL